MSGASTTPITPTSLGYFVIEAQDLVTWRRFAVDVIGLPSSDAATPGTLALRLDDHVQRILVETGPADDLVAVGWAFDSEELLEACVRQVAGHGVAIEEGGAALCRARRVERLLMCSDPSGLRHELHYGPAMAPRDQPFRSPLLTGGFVAGRLGAGHYVAAVRDKAVADHFYRRVLGLRLSDYIRGEIAPGGPVLDATFLHAATGRHHSVAFAAVPAPKRIHHIMVEMAEMNDVGLARDRCRAAGVPLMMDLGRHPNDGMFSFYAVTPSGFGLEIGSGGRVIDDTDWEVRSYARLSDWGHQAPTSGH
jgi:2,3-dihydroxybiphenyl 1,2-dioxygenase